MLEKRNEGGFERMKQVSEIPDPAVSRPQATFGDALKTEKTNLLQRVKTLETDIKDARQNETDAKNKQLELAKEVETVAKKLKALEAMGQIYD